MPPKVKFEDKVIDDEDLGHYEDPIEVSDDDQDYDEEVDDAPTSRTGDFIMPERLGKLHYQQRSVSDLMGKLSEKGLEKMLNSWQVY